MGFPLFCSFPMHWDHSLAELRHPLQEIRGFLVQAVPQALVEEQFTGTGA